MNRLSRSPASHLMLQDRAFKNRVHEFGFTASAAAAEIREREKERRSAVACTTISQERTESFRNLRDKRRRDSRGMSCSSSGILPPILPLPRICIRWQLAPSCKQRLRPLQRLLHHPTCIPNTGFACLSRSERERGMERRDAEGERRSSRS